MKESQVTITFRAKRDDDWPNGPGGPGYKMPRLTHKHVTLTDPRDRGTMTLAAELIRTLDNEGLTTNRLRGWAGIRHRSVVFPSLDEGWTVTPDRSGFMATISRTVTLTRGA